MWRNARIYMIIFVLVAGVSDAGHGKNAAEAEEAEDTAPAVPRVYVDMSSTYTAIPANSFAVGFRNSISMVNLTSLSSRAVALSVPVAIDLSDRLSVYAGINTYASQSDGYAWTSMIVDSWSAGLQAVVLEQNGAVPSVTVQSTFTQSIGGVISARGTASVIEFGYALNEDETYGLMAGIKYANVMIDSTILNVGPSTIGYVGGYNQWPNNWKLTGRLGVQAFDGANLGSLLQTKPFTLPIIRFDLDRMTDDDQIRFGLTTEVAWAPQPTFQLTLRTPITLR